LLFNFPTETTPLALYLLFYQIKNCVSKEPYAFLTYTVNITLPLVEKTTFFLQAFLFYTVSLDIHQVSDAEKALPHA
ncbi:hypothetical protein, partial [Bacillus subtilis]|uniref:hypothetical protein n=1 Tax=Bacillus subtilis TaxID=1423 RepID=UPI000B02245B